ncbi:RNA methyltransferase [Clostridium malenominatum]|uniref:RNA methyltransferase n=1 Tax=Clostridium malenominatum TaxID=1539 RepID=A0ABN1INX0_9CLOT
MEFIASKDNSLFKELKRLKEKKHRVKEGKFLVEGFRFVEEALNSDFTLSHIILSESSKDKYVELELKNRVKDHTKIYVLGEALFKTLSDTENPQGILAVLENKKREIEDNFGFYVLADRVQDPGNMGTIIRTAHAAGALGVITTEGTVDIYNDKTLRSTMGSIFYIHILENKDLDFLKSLKEKGYNFLVSSLESKNNIYDLNLKNKKLVICIGNEGNGISQEVFKLGDENFKIPMPGGAESLNAAIAAAVIMFEIVRQNTI